MQRRRHGLRSTHKFVNQLFRVCSWNRSSWCLSNVAAFWRKNKLRYTIFLGDGDSKSFSAVSQEVWYPVAKIDCVGHVQKRLGTRLCNLVKKEKFADGSCLGGKGKLTKAQIGSTQNYFGQAIRSHSHDLEGMQTAVKAILYHSVDNENREEQHRYCPKGKIVGANFRRTRQIRQTPTTPEIACPPGIFQRKDNWV